MAQHDYIISNQSGAGFRSDLNNALAAIVSQNSGASEPSTTYAYQFWADTTAGVLKQRNAANNAWITLFQLDGEWSTIALENGTAAAPSLYFKDSGTDTGVYSPGTDQVGIATAGVQRVNFNGSTEVVFNDGGADVDFRIEGDTEPNLFVVDAGTDQVRVANLNGGPLAGTRNRIINGDMRIDQRAASQTVNSNANFYSVDRWFGSGESTDGVFTLASSTTAPANFTNSLLATVTTADASIGASQRYIISQRIEGNNVADLGWGTADAKAVVLSFWVRSSLTGTFGGSIRNSATDRSYPFSYSISAANTWEQKTVSIAGDTSGTWLTDTGIGITLSFALGAGSSAKGTAGAWSASNLSSATGAVDLIGTNGATLRITGVQLETGAIATPFERRNYGHELLLCYRYCQVIQAFRAGSFETFLSYYGGTAVVSPDTSYILPMRATPTGSITNAGVQYYSYAGVWTNTTLTLSISDNNTYYLYCASDGDGRGKLMRSGSSGTAPNPVLLFTAEL